MGSNAKRERDTLLPNALWSESEDVVVEGTGNPASPPKKSAQNNHTYRFGIPIVASENSEAAAKSKNPTTKYHRSYMIDQAGPGVVALKDEESFPICLIKNCKLQNPRSLRMLRYTSHKNLVSLIDNFQAAGKLHLVYEYEHLAISLGCVAGTVQFSEADIATICKEVLEGLNYIHTVLKSSYGLLNFSNILLTWQGDVKIGMSCS